MSREAVLRIVWRRCGTGRRRHHRLITLGDVLHNGVDVLRSERRERRHPASAVEDQRAHVSLLHAVTNADERWDGRRRAGPVIAMA